MDEEQLNLEVIGELNDPDANYSFNDLKVWRHKETGKLYYATDSGCSCPSPFEDFSTIESLSPITEATWSDFEKAVKDHCSNGPDKIELLVKVKGLLK